MRILAASLLAAVVSIAVAASTPTLPAQQTSDTIAPPAGARTLLQAKGDGVQIYTCAAAPEGLKWVLKAPDAKLLDASGKAIGRHFAGPTWSLNDGSKVQGQLLASQPAPEANSVAWLLLVTKPGTATGSLANVKFIRRSETHGGVAPASGCQTPADAEKLTRIPYTATYTFYVEK